MVKPFERFLNYLKTVQVSNSNFVSVCLRTFDLFAHTPKMTYVAKLFFIGLALTLLVVAIASSFLGSKKRSIDSAHDLWSLAAGTSKPVDLSLKNLRQAIEQASSSSKSNSSVQFGDKEEFVDEDFALAAQIGSSKFRWKRNETLAHETRRLLRVHLTAIHIDQAEFPLSKLLFMLTLRLAVNSVSKQLEQQHRVKLVLSVRGANTCSKQFAGAIAAEEYYTKRARLFIVSGCDDALRGVSRLASQWKVPIMTAAGFSADLDDKSVHKTLIRVAFSMRAAVEFLFKVLKSFQWRRVNLVADESDANSLAMRSSIEEHSQQLQKLQAANASSAGAGDKQHQDQYTLRLNTISLDFKSLLSSGAAGRSQATQQANASEPDADKWPSELMRRAIDDALGHCALFSRVTILLVPQRHLRKFMLSVYDQNMANGLYTFINLPLIYEEIQSNAADQTGAEQQGQAPGRMTIAQAQQPLSYSSSTGDNVFLWRVARSQRNSHAKQAFESLMSISLRVPNTKAYVYFASQLSNLANTDYATTIAPISRLAPANSNRTVADRPKTLRLNVNPYLASFYDSLQIYATALNESLASLKRQQQRRPASLLQLQQQQQSDPTSEQRHKMAKALSLHAQISELVRARRYYNMVTGSIYINSNGDRETDYTLDDMNHMTGKFAPVILYRGETRAIERLGRIHWSSDASVGPTSDTVDCNLTFTCANKPMTKFVLILTLMAGPLVLIVSSMAYFIHSRLSLESQLVDHWWKIHMNEIEIVLTRRKNANDGTILMNSTTPGGNMSGTGLGGSNAPVTGSESSLPKYNTSAGMRQTNESAIGERAPDTNGAGGHNMLIGAGGHFKTSTVVASGQSLGGQTAITKATKETDTSVRHWGQSSSVREVCYGNITLGIYRQSKVALKPIAKFHQSRKLMVELRSIKDINHTNLCRFVGIIVDEGNWAIVAEFCPKGSLREFFHNESMVIDWTFKYSIINDILAGLNYLHSSPVGYHGRLKSSNCLVDARFVVKLSDYGPHSLYERIDSEELCRISLKRSDTNESGKNNQADDNVEQKAIDDESLLLRKLIWLAPEHMAPSSKTIGSMRGDVYSFGLLLYEIITNLMPFFDEEKDDFIMPLKTLYQELRNHGPNESTGPHTGDIILSDEKQSIEPLVNLMKLCWHYDPAKRPTLQEVNFSLKRITKGVTSKKLLENLTTRMEQYTNNLESLVEAKLATLVGEKLKTEELLYQFVPQSIAASLKEGQFVEPEAFECVTVFYSDIVGFTSLSSESSPMEVVDFLSDLYFCFDETLEQHDIFKVDTIGDAYIVASGLPQRNNGKHVVEIAYVALELRDRLRNFKIPHKPGRNLEMRVGIHSGPCIAGIVGGLNMPKYCVFGDTLTTGKFMESTGLPMKIHITEESKNLLTSADEFTIKPRQPKITRDGLPFQTYWLERA